VFIASGGIVLVCHLAFKWTVVQCVEKDKLSSDDAGKAARAHLIPGVIVQPSGFSRRSKRRTKAANT
jgi:hypothetical protein